MLSTFSGRRASQNEYELNAFIALLLKHNVRSYLEIGARHGDTFHAVMSALPRGSYGVAVDLGGGAWGTPKSVVYLERAIEDLRRNYRVHVIFGDSNSPSTIDSVRHHGNFDAVFIDGDHRYDGVNADWRNYGCSSIVAFHDIVGDGQRDKQNGYVVEVPQLWNEIKMGHKYVEYIDKNSAMGIGVILK